MVFFGGQKLKFAFETQESNAEPLEGVVPEERLHEPVEDLLPQGESAIHLGDFMTMAKMVGGFVMPRKSPMETFLQSNKSETS